MFKEFKEFALKGNLIDMAVAFVMGAAFTKLSGSFIEDLVMPLIASPLAPLLRAAALGALADEFAPDVEGVCVGVVLASGGYPGPIVTGHPVTGIPEAEAMDAVHVFHAGTALRDNVLVTSGGRVLTVAATGSTYADARARAYRAAASIAFEGKQFRSDIGASLD